MDQKTLIFDISSDEELGFDNSSTLVTDDFEWISKILEDVTDTPDDHFDLQNSDHHTIDQKITVSGNKISKQNNVDDDDDDDDVVIVGEVIVKPKRAKRSFSVVNNDDDDDDCVVLECDPDKKPSVANDEGKNCDDDGDTDDLVVVGEKGQVACRDFPHSRHMCANFPFSSTSHECRCDLCHCYVCDSLAPCAYWGSGALTTDHCHATDKVGFWQIERRKFRQLKNPPLPTPKPVVSLAQFPQPVQTHPQHRSRGVSTCGVNPPFDVPNIFRQGQTHRPNVTVARNGYYPQLVSRQLSSTCHSNAQGNKTTLSASGMTSRPIFKRAGVPIRASYCSPSTVSVAFSHPQHLASKPIENTSANLHGLSPLKIVNPSANIHGSSPRLVANPSANVHGSSPRLVANPSANVHGSSPQLVMNPSAKLHEPSPRLVINPMSYQSNSNSLTSHRHVIPQSHTPISRPQVRAQPSDIRYTNSPMHQGQTISSSLVPCSTSRALSQASKSSQQTIAVPDFLFPTAEMPSNITQMSNQASGVALNYSSNPCNSLDDLGILPMGPFVKDLQSEFDFNVDSWLEGNLTEGSFLDMNSQALQTTPIDAGMLYFDFETSWKGLAHS